MFKQWLMKESFDPENDPIDNDIEQEKQDRTFTQLPPAPRETLSDLELKIKSLFRLLRGIDPEFSQQFLNYIYSYNGSKLRQDVESMLQTKSPDEVAKAIVNLYTSPDINSN